MEIELGLGGRWKAPTRRAGRYSATCPYKTLTQFSDDVDQGLLSRAKSA